MLVIPNIDTKIDLIAFHLSRHNTKIKHDPKDWVALFIRYPEGELENTYKVMMTHLLKHKGIEHFLFAKEEPNHFHVMLQCADYDYQNWIAALKNHMPYQLAGKNSGTPGNYGRVKLIKNLDNMLSYTIKEHDYLCSFDTTEWFEKAKDYSFKKTKLTRQTFREKLFQFLSDRNYHDLRTCQIRIIDFYRKQDPMPSLTKAAIRNHALNYFMMIKQEPDGLIYSYSSENIYDFLNEY